MKRLIIFIKVNWHCLYRIFKFDFGHRVCSFHYGDKKPRFMCSCGYMNNGKTFEQEIYDFLQGNGN